jgi:hypothetical protein
MNVGGIADRALLVGQFGPLEGHALGQDVRGQFLHGLQRLARRDARGGIALQRHRRIHVVALDEVGAGGLADFDQGAQRHQRTGGRAHAQAVDIVLGQAEALVGLGAHLVDAAEGIVVVDEGRAEIDLQGLEDIGDRHVEDLGLLPVDIEEDLRRAGGEGGEHARQLLVLPRRAHQLVGGGQHAADVAAGAVLDLQLEAAGIADAPHGRRRDGDDEGFLHGPAGARTGRAR